MPPNTAAVAANKTASPTAPAKVRRELDGNKWYLENFDKTNAPASGVVLEESETEAKHVVNIFNCTGVTILVKGKINAINMGKFGRK